MLPDDDRNDKSKKRLRIKRGKRVSEKKATTSEEVKRDSGDVRDESVATAVKVEEPKSSQGMVGITYLRGARLILPVAPSGAKYVFSSAGETVLVAEEDVAFVMAYNRNRNRGCCGGGSRIYFQLEG